MSNRKKYFEEEIKDSNGKHIVMREGHPLGYLQALDGWKEWYPKEGFKIAGKDEEVLSTPAAVIRVAVVGPGEVFVDGLKILPYKVYHDATVYKYESIGQSFGGKFPGIKSLKISEGTQYRYYVEGLCTGCL